MAIYTHVAAALVAASLAAAGTWQIQNWRWTSRTQADDLARQSALLESTREARRIESARNLNLLEAINAQTTRARTLAADAAAARAESHSLRDDLAAIAARLPSPAACPGIEPAATATQLLAECAGAYQDLARQADGHASDALMLMQAWPSK